MSASLTSIKVIYDLLKNAKDAQLAMKISGEIAALQGKLLDVQQEALKLQTENQELRAENEGFRSFVFHHSVNWRVRPDGSEDGPFCPVCHGEGVGMRLILRGVVDQTGDLLHLQCPKPHFVGAGLEGVSGRGRELNYAVPKKLVPTDQYFLER